MQKITPFLWFESGAEQAAQFYVSLFENAKILSITRYDAAGAKASGQPEGSVMTASFQLEGQDFTAINGGPFFTFSGAVSFVINCQTQQEIDHFWEKLSKGGESGVCGWINRDKFGVTWQVVPTILEIYLADPDKERSSRVMEAMLKMTKLEISKLEAAYRG